MRRSRRGGGFHQELGGSGEDSFVAVVVTKLTGALLFILLLTMAIMALIPKADQMQTAKSVSDSKSSELLLNLPPIMPEGIDQRPYHYTFSVRGELTGPLVWSLEGELPKGLTFDSNSGVISGQAEISETIRTELKVNVSDGRRVVSGITQLPVWKPDTTFSDSQATDSIAVRTPEKSLQQLIANGFGFALIWLGHFSGLGVIHRFETEQKTSMIQTETNPRRYRIYRYFLWILSFICTGFIVTLIV